ncbi:hypothetical protein TKK_0001178 [Trichogramma kaykai]|uniref:RNA helicase n=1 Tax=Trichogramma kaykai TaxID=54128 RepID=A0ABD2WVY9_9HYME
MFSIIQRIASKVLWTESPSINEEDDAESSENEEIITEKSSDNKVILSREVLDFVNELSQIQPEESEVTEEPQLNVIDRDKGCFYKTGIVSRVTEQLILIENKYTCEAKYVVPTNLKVGDEVYYLAYKVNENEELKVRRVERRVDKLWDESDHNDDDENNQNFSIQMSSLKRQPNCYDDDDENEILPLKSHTDQVIESRDIHQRTVVTKVIGRKAREVFLENVNISVNLNNAHCDFIPYIGDWVKLDCVVEVDESNPNLEGEIMEITSMKPQRQINKVGKITEYDEFKEVGSVNKDIVFNKSSCASGYLPFKDDTVIVQAIESDQSIGKRWRALKVVPIEEQSSKHIVLDVHPQVQMPEEQLLELIKDKESVEITNNINITLEAKEEKDFEVVIRNDSNIKLMLQSCSFSRKRYQSQIIVLFPKKEESRIPIHPGTQLTCTFRCRGKLVGDSEEIIIFKFRKSSLYFQVGRIVKITVKSITSATQQANSNGPTNQREAPKHLSILELEDNGEYIKGVKPYAPAKFITNKTIVPRIPKTLWTLINTIDIENKSRIEAQGFLEEGVPVLSQPLSFNNYKLRFGYLLFLEQIAMVQDLRRYDMASAILIRSGEYLSLNVPGLVEKRPSLIVGDRIIVSFKWSRKTDNQYEGYIHKIRSSDIFVKFDESFHQTYGGEDCAVHFKGSTSVVNRCHTALGEVVKKLGEQFLFPTRVIEKEPQYNIIDEHDNKENTEHNTNEKDEDEITTENANEKILNLMKNKRIEWFNKSLNIYQKEAVKNVLKGVARPLPYVIFGPPGTGKTITLCETILQITSLLPDSRILIATPSNSSANLIAERLLDSNVLKPGDLVRLIAFSYLNSDSVPEKLLPYCVTADIAAEGSRIHVNIDDPRGCKTNVTLSVLVRYQIIIGTCSALGIIYNMGVSPGHFTHVLIDEAGQASEPEIMIPLSLVHAESTQVILAGDPKQLGPVNQSRLASYFGLSESFLVRLLQQFPYKRDEQGFEFGYDPRLITKLRMNYRSLPGLLELPNRLFYEAELIPMVHPEESEEALLLESLSDMLPQGRLGSPPAIVFHGIDGKNEQDTESPSWYNPQEATQVYIYLMELYNKGIKPEDIGIITPYTKQVHHIRSLLSELDTEIPKVGSVEEFQGQERKIIILSVVRTSDAEVGVDVRHALGFISSTERLNVAITRARSLLIIVGCPRLLKKDIHWRSVLEYCITSRAYIGVDY